MINEHNPSTLFEFQRIFCTKNNFCNWSHLINTFQTTMVTIATIDASQSASQLMNARFSISPNSFFDLKMKINQLGAARKKTFFSTML